MTSRVWLLLVLLVLTIASAGVLATENRLQGGQAAQAEAFQQLLGGLGFGPALDLSVCPFGFDPRLDDSCANDSAPLPGGTCFCPQHAGSLLNYSSPPHRDSIWLVEPNDAPPS